MKRILALLLSLLTLMTLTAQAEAMTGTLTLCRSKAKTENNGLTTFEVHFMDEASNTSIPILSYKQNTDLSNINKVLLYSMNNGKFYAESCMQDGNMTRNYILFSRANDGLLIERTLTLTIRDSRLNLVNNVTGVTLYNVNNAVRNVIPEAACNFLNDQLASEGVTVSEEGTKVTGGSLLYNLENNAISALAEVSGLPENVRALRATNAVKLRSGSGTQYESVVSMHLGDVGTYLNTKQNGSDGVVWYRIDFDGRQGWVSSDYVEFEDAESTVKMARILGADVEGEAASGGKSEPGQAFGSIVTVTAEGGVKLRSGAGTNYEKKLILERGAIGETMGESKEDSEGRLWIKVNVAGHEGWLCKDYISIEGETAAAEAVETAEAATEGETQAVPTAAPGERSSVTALQNVRIRGGAGTSFDEIAILTQGEKAEYLGTQTTDAEGIEWYKVRYNDQEGWIMAQYVDLHRVIAQVG